MYDGKPQTALSRLWEYLESVYGREAMLAAKYFHDAQNREYQQYLRDKSKAELKEIRAQAQFIRPEPTTEQARRDSIARQENAEMIPEYDRPVWTFTGNSPRDMPDARSLAMLNGALRINPGQVWQIEQYRRLKRLYPEELAEDKQYSPEELADLMVEMEKRPQTKADRLMQAEEIETDPFIRDDAEQFEVDNSYDNYYD